MLGLIGLQDKSVGTLSDRVILLLNSLTAAKVIVDVAETPRDTGAGFEAAIVKSGDFGLEKMFVDCILISVYST